MRDWPEQAAPPPPELVAAWLVLDTLDTARVPAWAAHWITTGHHGRALGQLARLRGDDPDDVLDLLDAALEECGITDPDPRPAVRERAAAEVAFDALAHLHLDGLANARWMTGVLYEIAQPEFPESITDLPLGGLHWLDTEWGAGWGRTDTELAQVVLDACIKQAARSEDPAAPGDCP